MPKGIKGSFKTFTCQNCGTEAKWGPSKNNIYCTSKCAGEAKKKETLKAWLEESYTNSYGKFPDVAKDYVFEQQGNCCGICGITDWNGKPITFQADHIDGDPANLKPSNLRVICPNCHSQTDTWGTKSRGPKVEKKRDWRNVYRRRRERERQKKDLTNNP